jgi:hypothetical protein
MIESLVPMLVLDDDAPDDLLRFAYASASSSRDVQSLVLLASRKELPADIAAKLDKSPNARILVARLTRRDADPESAMAAARDRRVTVAQAVAQTPHLEERVYEEVFSRHTDSSKVMLALVSNPSVPSRLAATALRNALRYVPSSHPNRYALSSAATNFVKAHPEFVNDVFDVGCLQGSGGAYSPEIMEAIFSSPAISSENITAITEKVLEEISEEMSNRSRYYGRHSYTSMAQLVCSFMDTPADLVQKILAALAPNAQAHRHAALRVGSVQREEFVPPPAQESTVVKEIIARANSLFDRLKALLSYEVSDEEFVQVLASPLRRSGYGYFSFIFAEMTASDREPLTELIRRSKDSDVRLAVLARAIGYEQVKPYLTPERAAAFVACSLNIVEKEREQGTRSFVCSDTWLLAVADFGISQDTARLFPAKSAKPTPLDISRAQLNAPRVYSQVAQYLWNHLGDDIAQWQMMYKLIEIGHGSLADCVVAAQEVFAEA